MKISAFTKLTPRQQHAMIMAMYLRSAIEDFHAANLSDAQMKELNQLLRRALFNIITFLETEDLEHDSKAQAFLEYLITGIPDYWEVPEQATYNDERGGDMSEAA